MTALRAKSSMPEGITIEPRSPEFDLQAALATDWVDNDAFLTAVFNAMSLSFPVGERSFIDSVRHFEEKIDDEKLLKEVKGFYRQEGIHSREHRKYNKILCEQRGYDLEALEGIYIEHNEASKKNPRVTPLVRLAFTVALEHFTASFGENILEGRLLGKVNGPIGELWRWHAMEELEHKSVAFDVYTEVGGPNKLRSGVMRIALWILAGDTLKVAFKMLRHDKQLWKWKTLKSFSSFLFSKKGFIRLHAASYRDFHRKDFNPWDVDNRDLLEKWKNMLEPETATA